MDDNDQQLQPVTVQPVNTSQPGREGGIYQMNQPAPIMSPKAGKGKFLILGVFIAFFLIGGSAAAYVQFFQSNPKKIWERSLESTQKGLDKLVELNQVEWPAANLDGSFNVTSPIAIDGTMSGKSDAKNGYATFDIGAAGVRVDGEFRSILTESGSPDVYFKVSGLEGVQSLLGSSLGAEESFIDPSVIDQVEDKWFSIDHTLFDQMVAESAVDERTITQADFNEFTSVTVDLLKDTLFSTGNNAVFTVKETVGKEQFEGTDTYKYVVAVNKENFKSFVTRMVDSYSELELTKLLTSNTGKSFKELIDYDGMIKELDAADFTNATADVWVEASGRYIRNVRIYPEKDSKDTNYLDIGIPYAGGDDIPMLVRATFDESGTKGVFAFEARINQQDNTRKLTLDLDMDSEGTKVAAKGELKITRSEESVTVEKPDGARSAYDLLGLFYQASGYDDSYGTIPEDGSLDQFLPQGLDTFPLDDVEL